MLNSSAQFSLISCRRTHLDQISSRISKRSGTGATYLYWIDASRQENSDCKPLSFYAKGKWFADLWYKCGQFWCHPADANGTHVQQHVQACVHTHAPMRAKKSITVLLNNILCVNFLKSHMPTWDVTHLENSNENQKDEFFIWYSNRLVLLKHTLTVKLFKISQENII